MPAEWDKFINLGHEMIKNHYQSNISDEMVYRCIMSRAYYAGYCTIRDQAINSGFTIEKSSEDHGRLRQHLVKCGYKEAASILTELRFDRNRADYNTECRIECMDAEKALREAARLLSLALFC